MRVPLSWLAEYVDFDPDPDALASKLTGVGLKVETVHRPGAGLEGVVVGEVLEIRDHPRADNLILAEVSTGDSKRQIVVGARNFAAGDKVPVALPGARLPGGVVIERQTKRGEASEGMLCSARELGIGEDHTGILVLAPESETGSDVRRLLGLDDAILEFEINPNRPDAMSLLGVAREVAALDGSELRVPDTSVRESGPSIEGAAGVTIEDVTGCPRYLARVIRGVRVGPSPGWVQMRLFQAGYRPISNVVDATNYALLVTGHPMHAFDLDRLVQRRIVVRRAKSGERIVTLDEEERTLDPDDLVIADATHAVAIAGVVGGKDTEVSEATTDILLESAYFDPVSILRTSKRHGIRTEASARFERGMDPGAVDQAAAYAASLISDWAGGEVATGTIDRYPEPRRPVAVSLRPERANLVLGTRLSSDQMTSALSRLGFEVTMQDGAIRAVVPTRRPDVTIEADLIEEIARLEGYDSVPSRLPSGRNRAGALAGDRLFLRRIRHLLTAAGVWEAQNSSLIGPADLDKIGYPEGHPARKAIRLVNALSSEESVLRPSLVPGLLASIARNVARRNLSVRLFEIGRCFLPADDLLPEEPLRLGFALHGPLDQEWHTPSREMDFYDLKGALEVVFAGLRISKAGYRPVEEVPFHPTRAASVVIDETTVGTIGEIAPGVAERYDLPYRAIVGELEVQALLERARPPRVPESGRFPAALVDLAIEVPEEVPAGEVLATARSSGGEHLEEARIFDLYRGEQIAKGNKSIAISLRFRHPDRTLTDAEALRWRDAIADAIVAAFGGRVRA